MSKILAPVIGFTFIVQLLAFAVGLGNNAILSRWLGPEGLGLFATIVIIIEFIYKIVNPGLDTSAVYFISSRKFNFKNYVSTYFVNSIIVFLLGISILLLLHNFNIIASYFNVISFSIITENILGISLYFFSFLLYEFGVKIPLGLQQFKQYNKLQMIKPFILFILLLTSSILFNAELNLVLIIIGVSFFIPALFYWQFAIPFGIKWDRQITKKSFKYGIKVMLGSIIQFINYRADIILIGYFLSGADVGWYFLSVLIAERLLFLTQATSTILLPAASSSAGQSKKTPLLSRLNFSVVLAGSVIIGLSAYWIVPLIFSSKYVNSVLPLIILLPGIISLSVSKLLSADLGARGLPQYSMYVSILNFILNIALNIILIPKIGIAGAALSSTISYTAALLFQAYFYKRITNIPLSELILLKKEDLKNLKNV